MKPADDEVSSQLLHCPMDGRAGWLEWWLPEPEEREAHPNELQLVMNHGKGANQNKHGYKRNDFHYFKHWRPAKEGEIQTSFRAWPKSAPLDDRRVRRFLGL